MWYGRENSNPRARRGAPAVLATRSGKPPDLSRGACVGPPHGPAPAKPGSGPLPRPGRRSDLSRKPTRSEDESPTRKGRSSSGPFRNVVRAGELESPSATRRTCGACDAFGEAPRLVEGGLCRPPSRSRPGEAGIGTSPPDPVGDPTSPGNPPDPKTGPQQERAALRAALSGMWYGRENSNPQPPDP